MFIAGYIDAEVNLVAFPSAATRTYCQARCRPPAGAGPQMRTAAAS